MSGRLLSLHNFILNWREACYFRFNNLNIDTCQHITIIKIESFEICDEYGGYVYSYINKIWNMSIHFNIVKIRIV